MTKIILILAALASPSTVLLTSGIRSWDLRGSDIYFGKYSTQLQGGATSAVSRAALAVSDNIETITDFERMTKTMGTGYTQSATH